MKCSAIVAIISMAAAAIAAPADVVARGGGRGGGRGGDTNVCSNTQAQVCCNGFLGCAVQIIGAGCVGSSYCCESQAPIGSLVNVNLLNCVDIL